MPLAELGGRIRGIPPQPEEKPGDDGPSGLHLAGLPSPQAIGGASVTRAVRACMLEPLPAMS